MIYERFQKQLDDSPYTIPGTEDCDHPEIDFSQYTLLGQDANASGCTTPEYRIEVAADHENVIYTYKITIEQYGLCEMAILANKWILVPAIPPEYTVHFEEEYRRVE